MSVLNASGLAKSFKRRKVVKDVSLRVQSGEIVGLLGPNGAGKTTSFYMVVGLIKHDSGNIFINDTDISDMPMHNRARLGIGYLPQEASVFRKLTVKENLLAILESRAELTSSRREETVEELLHELHISHLRDAKGMALSGGERRRVEIARALSAEPNFILLDEPFAGVDPISVIDIQRIIKQLSERGIGVLITDHNVRETLNICERAYIINDGSVITEGDQQHILEHEEVRQVYLGDNFQM